MRKVTALFLMLCLGLLVTGCGDEGAETPADGKSSTDPASIMQGMPAPPGTIDAAPKADDEANTDEAAMDDDSPEADADADTTPKPE